MGYRVFTTTEYDECLKAQPLKSAVQIEKRIFNIEMDDHFGTINDVGDDVWELKWQNGRRVYYAYLQEPNIFLLLGGNKNGQKYDIKQAQKILKEYTYNEIEV